MDGPSGSVEMDQTGPAGPGRAARPAGFPGERPSARGVERPADRGLRYVWIGAALGLGAPVGFALLRRWSSKSRSSLRKELSSEALVYAYLTFSTPVVFGLFGSALARRERNLRAYDAYIERLRGEFAAVVAHDLRSPIQAIALRMEMLLGRAGNGEVTVPVDALRALQRSARRLGTMVDDLLDATRIEASRLKISPRPVALPEAVSALVEQIRPALGGHEVEIVVEGRPPQVCVDPTRLDQILTNLIENAAKYGTPGAPIVVRISPEDAGATVAVEDQGPGIPASELPRLFDRFYQAKRARAMKSGLGLGLYITKGLVEAHGGRIAVESRVGRGSIFTVWLPSMLETSVG